MTCYIKLMKAKIIYKIKTYCTQIYEWKYTKRSYYTQSHSLSDNSIQVENLRVVVLPLLFLFLWFGFLAVVGVLGIFSFPSDDSTKFSFFLFKFISFLKIASFSLSVFEVHTVSGTCNFLDQGAKAKFPCPWSALRMSLYCSLTILWSFSTNSGA